MYMPVQSPPAAQARLHSRRCLANSKKGGCCYSFDTSPPCALRERGHADAAGRNYRRASSGRHRPQRLAVVRERGCARPAAARRALHQVVLDELHAQQQSARVAQVVLGCAHATGYHAPKPKAHRGSEVQTLMTQMQSNAT